MTSPEAPGTLPWKKPAGPVWWACMAVSVATLAVFGLFIGGMVAAEWLRYQAGRRQACADPVHDLKARAA